MGPVQGSESFHWRRCDTHGLQVKALKKIICDAEHELNELYVSIKEASRKKAKPEPKEEEQATTEELTRLSNAWCEENRILICNAKRAGSAHIEFQVNEAHPFDPQVSWNLVQDMGVKSFSYDRDAETIKFVF